MRARPPYSRLRRAALIGAAALLGSAVATAGASAAKKPTSVTRSSGGVTAKVTYTPPKKSYLGYEHLRLTVTGPHGGLTSARLPHASSTYSRPLVSFSDLNGDGTLDPIVDTFTGGAHCCSITTVALSTPTGFAIPITQPFGDYGYKLQTLPGSTTPVFVSADDRFAYAFTAYAGSIPPIQIWSAATGAWVNVTRNFPAQIQADVTTVSGYWDQAIKDASGDKTLGAEEVQAVAAAWVADLSLLGDVAGAKAVLDKLTAAGYMTGGAKEDWTNAKTFAGQLAYDLKTWGYLADPTTIGLPAVP